MTATVANVHPINLRGLLNIFLIFLKLGLTSFGGPIAHLGYFRHEFVTKRAWFDEHAYADLVALCQFLPGPASSQVGIAIGLSRGGIPGAIASFLGFTLPSAIALILFALSINYFGQALGSGWLHGLKVVSVAVVAQALWGMGKSLAPDRLRATIAVAAAVMVSLLPATIGQISAIILGGIVGTLFLRSDTPLPHTPLNNRGSRVTATVLLAIFFLLLLLLPALAAGSDSYILKLFDCFYRAGALVFGGGHVVLPLLQSQVVPAGWVSNDAFLAGYGATQAVPGPLFTFAAYLGAASSQSPSGWVGGGIALVAIFLPAFLLVAGTLPFWEQLRRNIAIKQAMLGINAVVVGLLLAAFYNPVWSSAIKTPVDFGMAVAGYLLLVFWKCPPWLVVALAAALGGIVPMIPM